VNLGYAKKGHAWRATAAAGAGLWVLAGSLVMACGGEGAESKPAVSAPPPKPAPSPAPTADVDPLGPRPEVEAAPAFVPPAPVVFRTANGMNVWLLERHAVPVVAVDIALPIGSASDPPGEGGLAWATANMLDEGAGSRGALELARAIDELGASLATGASADHSHASLFVLKRNLTPAFGLLADVVTRPRFDATEWKRVHDLWMNDLKARTREPAAVARVVASAALYGADQPYGHPTSGSTSSAARVDLARIKRFYRANWRPDQATVVAAGDITRAEISAILEQAFSGWKAPSSAGTDAKAVPAAKAESGAQHSRLILVDRPDAPQSQILVVRPGPSISDADATVLSRANIALGGSFTSRLNSDLREEHGWTYGAGSRVASMRQAGTIFFSSAVHTKNTGDALKAMQSDIDVFSSKGLTPVEVERTRMLSRAELVEQYERVEHTASLLAGDAALGLPPSYESDAAVRRDAATKSDLDRVAQRWLDAKDAVVVIVGPQSSVLPQLEALHLPKPELFDAEGNPRAPHAAK